MANITSLILARKEGQIINVGGDGGYPLIRIEVSEIRGTQVKLRIQAPRNVSVNRDEITRAIAAETGGAE